MQGHTPNGNQRATDDVAENIRNEQQRAAVPGPEEVEKQRRKTEEFHAEMKAVQAFLESLDERDHVDLAFSVAEHCDFQTFEEKAGSRIHRWHQGQRKWKELKRGHLEDYEHPGPPSDFERQAPPSASIPPFEVTERVRELKAQAWLQLPDPDETTIEKEHLDAGGAVRYRVTITSPRGETITQLIEERDN
ncbi:hypothetical protein [Halorhabdus rudnickae]|uniref:hypothetical protein n=1 Tax=Halorhabdus rudnickae TaxID=1775544 RepID=UPI00108407C2|nr:hypothetical protein [Halorhabdus rudnickae]